MPLSTGKVDNNIDENRIYYVYVLLYVDDCMAISENPREALVEIDKYFPMKKGSISEPDVYLGAKLRKVLLDNGVEAWSFSPAQYVTESVKNVVRGITRM